MSATEQKHTTGPRRRTPAPWLSKEIAWQYDGSHALMWCDKSKGGEHWRRLDEQCNGRFSAPDARLLAAAPELLEVLHECIDAQWVIDSHAVEFDGTVHFGPYYDFSGLDGTDRHEFLAEYSCVVWPSGGKWSAYCAYEGSTWFEAFDRADAAKEACMKLLDKVMPTHPAMKARAAIAKATGATHD